MVSILLIFLQSFTLAVVLISLNITYSTFKDFYTNIGFVIILAYAFFAVYNILEILILSLNNLEIALIVSRVSSGVLGTGYFLLHYFHDEMSAVYRQRNTMTLGSFLYGAVIGAAWFEQAIRIDEVSGSPIVSKWYGMLVISQATLTVYRLTSHLIIMSNLSDHYGISSAISTTLRNIFQKLIMAVLILAIVLMIFVNDIVSLPFAMITGIGLIFLSFLYKLDPISSVPIAQQMKAIALISNQKVKFLHQFSEDFQNFIGLENFGELITNLGQLYADITNSQTRVISFSSGTEIHFMYETVGDAYLLLIIERKAPFVRKILQSLSQKILANQIDSQIQFSQLVQKHLVNPQLNY